MAKHINSIVPNSAEIAGRRIRAGLTTYDIAESAGVSQGAVVRAENGIPVRPRTASAICKALGANFDELFTIRINCDDRAAVQP